tara:strand:- start:39 stop:431 length:393 start_codon:yes stop_codon:yes gene_type:complete
MKHTLIIITALMLVVGCGSSKEELIESRYDSGQLMIRGYMKDGEYVGKWTQWYENGLKWMEYSYKNGKRDGKWTEWHENGQKKREETYKNGKRDGKWTGWYENGQKDLERTYKDGGLIETTNWDEDGNEF